MDNNFTKQSEGISNLFELENISTIINKLKIQIEQISNNIVLDSFERKIRIRELNEEKSFLEKKLLKGIRIDSSPIFEEIKNSIIKFLEEQGFETSIIKEKFNNIKFYITNERLSSGGLLSTYSNKVAIDYSLIEFDENGNFINFKKEKEDFIKYLITHELLHICSAKANKSFNNDALSEGYTDLLAQFISGNNKDKSENYDFFVRICTLFTSLVGNKETLNDYFKNLDTLPNLRGLFKECGLEDENFFEFYQALNKLMNLQIENKNNEGINELKINLLSSLKSHIFIPYIKTNIEDKENYIAIFNNLFENFGIECSLDEINSISK